MKITVDELQRRLNAALQKDTRFQQKKEGEPCRIWVRDTILGEDGTPNYVIINDTESQSLLKLAFTIDAEDNVTLDAGAPEPTEVIYARSRETSGVIRARDVSHTFDTNEPPPRIMYMPGGVSTITADYHGRPIRLTVNCIPETAAVANGSLAALRARFPKQKPFGDVDHHEEEAAFYPGRFGWQDGTEPGVMVEDVDWSEAGGRHIRGKNYRSFSPTFDTDAEYSKAVPANPKDPESTLIFPDHVRGGRNNPARVTGIGFVIGSLTNLPAFQRISPIRAKQANPQPEQSNAEQTKGKHTMKVKLIKARGNYAAGAVIDMDQTEAVTAIIAGEAMEAGAAEQLDGKDAAIRARDQQITSMREQVIDGAIQRAKDGNRIPPKDDKVRARALKIAASDMEAALEYVNGLNMSGASAAGAEQRMTSGTDANASGEKPVLGYGAVRASVTDIALGYCNARTTQNQLVRAGNMKSAYDEALASSRILAYDLVPAIRASGGNYLLKHMVRAADVTDANLGTLSTGLLVLRDLGFLKNMLSAIGTITTDFRNEPALLNQPIISRYFTVPGVQTFSPTEGWPEATPAAVNVTLIINQHKGVAISFGNDTLAQTARNLVDEQRPLQFYALAESIITALFNTAVNGSTRILNNGSSATVKFTADPYVKSIASFGLPEMPALQLKMDLLKIPDVPGNRGIHIHPALYSRLGQDTNLILAETIKSALGKGVDMMGTGKLPTLSNIEPDKSQLYSDNADYTKATTLGWGGSKASMILAARLPQDYTQIMSGVPSTASIEVVTEPDTGLAILLTRYLDHDLEKAKQRAVLMYGTGIGDERQGFLINQK